MVPKDGRILVEPPRYRRLLLVSSSLPRRVQGGVPCGGGLVAHSEIGRRETSCAANRRADVSSGRGGSPQGRLDDRRLQADASLAGGGFAAGVIAQLSLAAPRG